MLRTAWNRRTLVLVLLVVAGRGEQWGGFSLFGDANGENVVTESTDSSSNEEEFQGLQLYDPVTGEKLGWIGD